MLLAPTQSGKSPAIVFLAWLAWHRFHCLPWVFTKNAGGAEQFKSTWMDKINDLNTKISRILASHPIIRLVDRRDHFRRFHLQPSHKYVMLAGNVTHLSIYR